MPNKLTDIIYRLLHRHPQPPLAREFERITLQPYTEHVNDCSNKAGQYARLLLAAGIDAHVILVQPQAPVGVGLHAIVQTGDLYCDPTTGAVSRRLDRFGVFVASVSASQIYTDPELATAPTVPSLPSSVPSSIPSPVPSLTSSPLPLSASPLPLSSSPLPPSPHRSPAS